MCEDEGGGAVPRAACVANAVVTYANPESVAEATRVLGGVRGGDGPAAGPGAAATAGWTGWTAGWTGGAAPAGWMADMRPAVGFGRIVALRRRSSALYRTREQCHVRRLCP